MKCSSPLMAPFETANARRVRRGEAGAMRRLLVVISLAAIFGVLASASGADTGDGFRADARMPAKAR